jgi:hypothetical protein
MGSQSKCIGLFHVKENKSLSRVTKGISCSQFFFQKEENKMFVFNDDTIFLSRLSHPFGYSNLFEARGQSYDFRIYNYNACDVVGQSGF